MTLPATVSTQTAAITTFNKQSLSLWITPSPKVSGILKRKEGSGPSVISRYHCITAFFNGVGSWCSSSFGFDVLAENGKRAVNCCDLFAIRCWLPLHRKSGNVGREGDLPVELCSSLYIYTSPKRSLMLIMIVVHPSNLFAVKNSVCFTQSLHPSLHV